MPKPGYVRQTLVLGIGQENHNRISEELNRLIIDCTIGFLFAMSNNIQRSLKEYQKPEHVCSWLKSDCQKCKVIISCQRCKVIQFRPSLKNCMFAVLLPIIFEVGR